MKQLIYATTLEEEECYAQLFFIGQFWPIDIFNAKYSEWYKNKALQTQIVKLKSIFNILSSVGVVENLFSRTFFPIKKILY